MTLENNISDSFNKSIGNIVAEIIGSFKGKAVREYETISFRMNKCFSVYASNTYAKCSKVKTLIHRNKAIDIKKAYVETDFLIESESLNQNDIYEKIINSDNIIITGSGGSGKSVFLKHLYLTLIENDSYGFPIFFELRRVSESDLQVGDLSELIYNHVFERSGDITYNQFKYALRKGIMPLLLDGFDELPVNYRKSLVDSIKFFSEKYPDNSIVMTSRPDDQFLGWEAFTCVQIKPLSENKIFSLLDKIEFDLEKKNAFKNAIKSTLYKTHTTFLSNPLLCTMMLLTYDSFGEIPNKKHIFYKECFDVLSIDHDALKNNYRRQFHSGLEIDAIAKIFERFCVVSFLDQVYEFNKLEYTYYINEAIDLLAEIEDIDPVDIEKDFLESLSIMQKDGDKISFIHRSFQEYFFATYAVSQKELSLNDLIFEMFCIDSNSTETFLMMHDMDTLAIECNFILPIASRMHAKMRSVDTDTHPYLILREFFEYCEIDTRSKDSYFQYRLIYYFKSNHIGLSLLDLCGAIGIIEKRSEVKSDGFFQEESESIKGFLKENNFRRYYCIKSNNKYFINLPTKNICNRYRDYIGSIVTHLEKVCVKRKQLRSKTLIEKIKKKRKK